MSYLWCILFKKSATQNSMIRKSFLISCLYGLLLSHAYAEDRHFPLPFKVAEDNPLNTITLGGMTVSVLQGFSGFNNGLEQVKGDIQYSQKQGLFIGMKLWPGATFYANPEIFYGYNASNNIGVASSVNVATARVESSSPYVQMQRLFVRQVIDFGGAKTNTEENVGGRSFALEQVINKLSDESGNHNLVITAGKFGIGDVFDDNIYSHDPSFHFMNLNFNALNAIDFAGNAWGTTIGAAAEYNREWLSIRGGLFQGSGLPPSNNLEPRPLESYMAIGELEVRHDVFMGRKGSVKLIPYYMNGYIDTLGGYNGVRGFYDYLPYFVKENLNKRTDWGIGLNIQQELTDHVGMFIRAGYDRKTTDLRDMTHGVNGGFVFKGSLWGRPNDEFGIAAGVNSQHGATFRDWSETLRIGTGTARFAPETNFETYYRWAFSKKLDISFDYQMINNPNFLSNSSPAHVFGIRLRANF